MAGLLCKALLKFAFDLLIVNTLLMQYLPSVLALMLVLIAALIHLTNHWVPDEPVWQY